MALISLSSLSIGILALYLFKLFLFPKKHQGATLPPGPKPKPLIGNLTDLPPAGKEEWVHWSKHKDLYGPISSVSVLGQTMIIINDVDIAFELMEKRGNVHSGRPRLVFGGEMCGWDATLVSQQNSTSFRAYRKNIGRILGTQAAAAKFNTLQDVEVRRFLLRVLEKPQNLVKHIRTEAGAVILQIAYGYTIESHKLDPLVDLADLALEQFSKSTVPGAWMVDIIPALRYLPDWFPGSGFKETARQWKKTLVETSDKPYAFVKHQIAHGKQKPSYTSKLLEEGKLTTEEESVVKWSAFSLYTGGADTTVSSLSTFFFALTLYPDVQRKAQEEIDRVVGTDRLPSYDDRVNLPYVDALVKEVLRWHPIGPMGVPHRADEDDVYDGYLIPKGAILLANIWMFLHDPKTYHNPDAFNPERFLGENPEPDPHSVAFGFGRRICPGRVLADATVYLTIAQALAVFNVSKGVDENGNEIEALPRFTPGIISHPAPFKATIRPRSPKHERLIRAVETEHPWKESDSKVLEEMTY